MELPVRGGEVAILEEEELDLPEAHVADPEGVGLTPICSVRDGDVEPRPARTVDLDGLVEGRGGVEDDSHADEVHANGVVRRRSLVVRDSDDDRAVPRDVQGRRVAGGVAARPEDVELREGLTRTRSQDDVREGSGRPD